MWRVHGLKSASYVCHRYYRRSLFQLLPRARKIALNFWLSCTYRNLKENSRLKNTWIPPWDVNKTTSKAFFFYPTDVGFEWRTYKLSEAKGTGNYGSLQGPLSSHLSISLPEKKNTTIIRLNCRLKLQMNCRFWGPPKFISDGYTIVACSFKLNHCICYLESLSLQAIHGHVFAYIMQTNCDLQYIQYINGSLKGTAPYTDSKYLLWSYYFS